MPRTRCQWVGNLPRRHPAEAIQQSQDLIVADLLHISTERIGCGRRYYRQRHNVDALAIDL